MNFSAWMPFWNSLDAVRRVHSDLELGAIVFFLLLAFFDALAHWTKDKDKEHRFGAIGIGFFFIAVTCELLGYAYGERNDNLSEGVIVSLSEAASKALGESDCALKNAGAAKTTADAAAATAGTAKDNAKAAGGTAEEAAKKARGALTTANSALSRANKANEELADRKLSDAQLVTISGKLKAFAGQQYKVVPYWDSHESLGIANGIHSALQGAQWRFIPPPATGIALMGGVVGVEVFHEPSASEATKKAAKALTDCLNAEGIFAYEKTGGPNPAESAIIDLSVGTKR